MRKRQRIRDGGGGSWMLIHVQSWEQQSHPSNPLKQGRQTGVGGGEGANEVRLRQIMKKTPMSLWKRTKRERISESNVLWRPRWGQAHLFLFARSALEQACAHRARAAFALESRVRSDQS